MILRTALMTLAFIAGFLASQEFYISEPTFVPSGDEWCLWGQFQTLKDYQRQERPDHAIIDIYHDQVWVYARCTLSTS